MRKSSHFLVLRVAAVTMAMTAFACAAARADHAPTFVIPGNPWVPVIIDGVDASYGVVEGDWGLSRPGHVPVTVYPAPHVIYEAPPRPGYFPSEGRPPRVGRHEIVPHGRVAAPAESFHRAWTTDGGAAPAPADISAVPDFPPPVIEAFPYRKHPRRPHRRGHR
jgi:hypothetical protein